MPITEYRRAVIELIDRHRPSNAAFFHRLAECSPDVLTSRVLDELYVGYQGAMHATRVMAYYIPHLDTIDLRMKKCKVLMDDDGALNGDSHHYQLRRAWSCMLGRSPSMADDEFGELDSLAARLDPVTSAFIVLVRELYPRSLGPWVIVEGLAHDWIGALMHGLEKHFPDIAQSDYFRENYVTQLEVRHAEEAFLVTEGILERRPDLLEETIAGARRMGEALDRLWSGFDKLLCAGSSTSPGDAA